MQSTLNATFPRFSRFLFYFISTLRLGLLLTYLAVPQIVCVPRTARRPAEMAAQEDEWTAIVVLCADG